MKEFINPEIEILELEAEDIMVLSGGDDDDDLPDIEGGLGWG